MNHRMLDRSFYLRPDPVRVARDLLGMVIVTRFKEGVTAAIIAETEAYAGIADRASHAHGGRRTPRTEPMYRQGGTAYVYLCYGIHHLFNIVTHREGTPHAILVRAVRPVDGIDVMRRRRAPSPLTTSGPGTAAQALGIHVRHSGLDLCAGPIHVEDRGVRIPDDQVITGPRVGVDYAGEDALLPYRFRAAPSWPPSHPA